MTNTISNAAPTIECNEQVDIHLRRVQSDDMAVFIAFCARVGLTFWVRETEPCEFELFEYPFQDGIVVSIEGRGAKSLEQAARKALGESLESS